MIGPITQNAERRTQNAERRTQNAERRTQNAERSTQYETLQFSPHPCGAGSNWNPEKNRREKRQNNEKNRWKRVENDENLSLIWKNKPNLLMAKMNVYTYMKRGYEDFSDFVRRKNKANSKPIKANYRALAGKLECPGQSW